MTLRPKDVPCLSCTRFPVDISHPICPVCSTTLAYDDIRQILRDHHQYLVDVPRIPTDHDFMDMSTYMIARTGVVLPSDNFPNAMSMTVRMTEFQSRECTPQQVMSALWELARTHVPNLVEVGIRVNIRSPNDKIPSSTLLNIRKVLPGEAETRH